MNQVDSITKIKIDTQTFIDALEKLEDGSGYVWDYAAVFRFIADILNGAGIEAEARYQDCDWSIVMAGEKHYFGTPLLDEPAKVLIQSIMYFADAVNSGDQYEAWYSYCSGEHFLNLKPKAPQGTETVTGLESTGTDAPAAAEESGIK